MEYYSVGRLDDLSDPIHRKRLSYEREYKEIGSNVYKSIKKRDKLNRLRKKIDALEIKSPKIPLIICVEERTGNSYAYEFFTKEPFEIEYIFDHTISRFTLLGTTSVRFNVYHTGDSDVNNYLEPVEAKQLIEPHLKNATRAKQVVKEYLDANRREEYKNREQKIQAENEKEQIQDELNRWFDRI